MDIEADRLAGISARCVGLSMVGNLLKVNDFCGQGGSLTPDASLFRAVFFERKPFFNQQLNASRGPLYCDHSVTSADVLLSVGMEMF
jgi:hypothetical protein